MNHPLPQDRLPPLVARATDPSNPSERKLAAARGILPMSPEHLLLALYQLCHDPDEGVARVARETLTGLPEEMVVGAVPRLSQPEVLDYLSEVFSASKNRMDALLRNKAIADETVERVAKGCIKDVADMVAANQERLLRHPAIIEALYANKNARMSTVDRVVTFAVRQGLELSGIPAYRELAASLGAEADTGEGRRGGQSHHVDALFDELQSEGMREEGGEDETLEVFGEATAGTLRDDSIFDEFDEAGRATGATHQTDLFSEFDREPGEDEEEQEKDSLKMDYQVSALSVSEKIRLALLGNSSHRALLITDSNKLVALAAIKSPTINDQEVLKYSTSRNVSEEVIRYIASKREWTRSYFVKVNLVNNPKTPLPTALRFLSHLRRNDLKSLVSNKNIPAALTTAAKNMMKRHERRSG